MSSERTGAQGVQMRHDAGGENGDVVASLEDAENAPLGMGFRHLDDLGCQGLEIFDLETQVANRVFQGRESPAIAIARGRMRTNVEDAGAALRFFPAAKPLFSRYRELVSQNSRNC